MSTISDLRKSIKQELPELQFKIKTVSFIDLARDSKVFILSDAWGMTKGNHELFNKVDAIAKKYNAIASW